MKILLGEVKNDFDGCYIFCIAAYFCILKKYE